jgi:hypothetical protein
MFDIFHIKDIHSWQRLVCFGAPIKQDSLVVNIKEPIWFGLFRAVLQRLERVQATAGSILLLTLILKKQTFLGRLQRHIAAEFEILMHIFSFVNQYMRGS